MVGQQGSQPVLGSGRDLPDLTRNWWDSLHINLHIIEELTQSAFVVFIVKLPRPPPTKMSKIKVNLHNRGRTKCTNNVQHFLL